MKTETRKQLIGVIFGVALGYGINQLPGLSNETKMYLGAFSVFVILAGAKALDKINK